MTFLPAPDLRSQEESVPSWFAQIVTDLERWDQVLSRPAWIQPVQPPKLPRRQAHRVVRPLAGCSHEGLQSIGDYGGKAAGFRQAEPIRHVHESQSSDVRSWRNNSNDVANDIIRRRWEDQRRAFCTMTRVCRQN